MMYVSRARASYMLFIFFVHRSASIIFQFFFVSMAFVQILWALKKRSNYWILSLSIFFLSVECRDILLIIIIIMTSINIWLTELWIWSNLASTSTILIVKIKLFSFLFWHCHLIDSFFNWWQQSRLIVIIE